MCLGGVRFRGVGDFVLVLAVKIEPRPFLWLRMTRPWDSQYSGVHFFLHSSSVGMHTILTLLDRCSVVAQEVRKSSASLPWRKPVCEFCQAKHQESATDTTFLRELTRNRKRPNTPSLSQHHEDFQIASSLTSAHCLTSFFMTPRFSEQSVN